MSSPRIDLHTRFPALDGLRGVAILLVMAFHYEARNFPGHGFFLPFWLVIREGWMGVDLFFVLSGFLITGILCDTRSSRSYFRTFYARRTLRIFPLYYGFLAMAFWLLPLLPLPGGPQAVPNVRAQVFSWFYLSNFLVGFDGWSASPDLVPHFWSLAVEEQFYLVWPALVYFATRRGLARICAVTVLLAIAVRFGLRHTGLPWYSRLVLTPARLDTFALGGLVALIVRDRSWVERASRWAARAALATAAAVVALLLVRGAADAQDRIVGTVGLSLIALACACVVGFAAVGNAANPVHRLLASSPLRLVGRYSYGMYVLHFPIMRLLGTRGLGISELHSLLGSYVGAHVVHVGLNSGLTLGLAALSFRFFESRFLALKDRFPYEEPVATTDGTERAPASGSA